MKVSAIQQNKINNTQRVHQNKHVTFQAPLSKNFTSIYATSGLQQNLSIANFSPKFSPSFAGTKFEDNVVKKIDADYFGKGLYNEHNFIDFNKCGWENLSKNQLDITKAKDEEIYAFQHANALAEAKDSSWVQRFNPDNVTKPLATFHTLCSKDSQNKFAQNLEELQNLSKNKSLDKPIASKNGKLILDCVVFDTETTGTNHSNDKKPIDKIIQFGAIQVKNGKTIDSTGLSQLIDPQMHIPEASSNVHGILDEDVKGKPKMNEYLGYFLNDYMKKDNGIIVAYNSKFDMSMLRNSVNDYNKEKPAEPLKNRRESKVLDPFILLQRIHPYVGAKKKLSEQYKFMFCKNLDDAHDAFADVKGTVNVMKYCLYYLNEHRKDANKPLTIREVLAFQNGGKVKNINLPLDNEGCNAKVQFNKSYRMVSVPVDNFFKGYTLTDKTLKSLETEIGKTNVKKLEKLKNIDIENFKDTLDEGVYPKQDSNVKKSRAKKEILQYTVSKNFKKALGYAGLQPYKGKPVKEIVDLITESSKNYVEENVVSLWLKNANPEDIKDGNDMIDYNIARKVIQEEKDSKNSIK